MKQITCPHCGDTYPDFDVAHVCSRGPYAVKLKPQMNTRIQALLDEVGTDVSGKWISVDDAETLAEAIIRECCTALQPALRDMISRGQGRELILEHFGFNPREITTFMLDRKIKHLEKELVEQKKSFFKE
jgi:hypothetical protein